MFIRYNGARAVVGQLRQEHTCWQLVVVVGMYQETV